MKMFLSKVDLIDKHDEGSYMNDDDQDDSDKKDGSHERFSDVIERSWSP